MMWIFLVILVYRYLYAYLSMIFERLRADLEVNSGIILADKRQFNASTTASKKQRNDLCLGWCGLESFDSNLTPPVVALIQVSWPSPISVPSQESVRGHEHLAMAAIFLEA